MAEALNGDAELVTLAVMQALPGFTPMCLTQQGPDQDRR
jgi:hypothetical protein